MAAILFYGQANACAVNIAGNDFEILLLSRIMRIEGPTGSIIILVAGSFELRDAYVGNRVPAGE